MCSTKAEQLEKSHRKRIQGEAHKEFIRSIFIRDGWACRYCGARRNLTPHHLKKRSQLGGDEPGNVITLCMQDHNDAEEGRLHIDVVDVVVTFSKGE